MHPDGLPATRPGARAGTWTGAWQLSHARDAPLGRHGHPRRPLAPPARRSKRRAARGRAERQIGVAEADLYPTIFINGTLGWDAADFSQAFSNRSFLGLLTPGFRWNILNYGRIKNNVHLQEAKTQELIASYQNQVLTAGREAQVALRGFLKSQERTDDLARSVEAAKAATDVGVAQYRAGTIDFNRVFNLETTQVQQQDQLASCAGRYRAQLDRRLSSPGRWVGAAFA